MYVVYMSYKLLSKINTRLFSGPAKWRRMISRENITDLQ